MVSSFVQLKSILWKNWLLKWAHFSGFIAELALPVVFMSLLIMIKGLTTVYDSPNVAYYCGNAYPWFYTNDASLEQLYNPDSTLSCLEKPPQCTAHDYYKYGDSFQPFKPVDNTTFTAFSQYGFISSAASSGNADAPFYAYTIGDPSQMYYIYTKDFKLDNPSLPICTMFMRMYYQSAPSVLAIAPLNEDDPSLVQQAKALRQFLISWCRSEGWDYSNTIVYYESQGAVESFVNSKHYDDAGNSKIAFSIILNSAEASTAQYDYSIRANYTSFWDTGDRTVACLYGNSHCDFTYTIPSTKFSTQDLLKPQSSEFLYGYTYSGFATLQQMVDQFILFEQNRIGRSEQDSSGSSDSSISRSDSTIDRTTPTTTNTDTTSNTKRRLDTTTTTTTTTNTTPSTSISALDKKVGDHISPYKIMASIGLMPTPAYVTDDFQYIISSTLGIFYMLSFLYPVSRIIRALVLEKETRIKEGMKMMGLTDTVYNLSWLITTLLQMTFVSILITVVTANSVFEYSNKVYVFIYFEAFSLAVINMCFLLSTLFSRSKSASLLGPMIFFASFFPYYAVNDDQFDASAKTATCVLAPACFALGAEVFADYEGGLVGVQSSNVALETSNFTYNACVGMLFFDAVLYGVLAWYLDNVLPSEFGTPLPWYFFLLPSYWCGGESSVGSYSGSYRNRQGSGGVWSSMLHYLGIQQRRYSSVSTVEEGGADNALHSGLLEEYSQHEENSGSVVKKQGEYIELVSADLQQQSVARTCLSIRDLRKVYTSAAGGSDRVAVDKLNMDLYQGQVTVLLGHNGAGKTTTISMLVGLTTPTAGNAYYPGGLAITADMHTIRRNLGVCPQHDILFPELTVMQHLQIYASFKGVNSSDVNSAAQHMLAEVGLTEKAHSRSSTLSGGQKRKLSLGIALIGDSKVVILDEPTSGMDPYSRRSTWNIIQRNKKGRIILLTTHFMDEADLLGDRVAIMAHGKLQCLGSPLFLKNKFGVGYTLTVVKNQQHTSGSGTSGSGSSGSVVVRSEFADPEPVDAQTSFVETSRRLLALVQEFIPTAEPLSDVGAEQSFRLPFTASSQFVSLFSAFDAHKEELCIAEYGISVTTLEEVFIRVGEMEESINMLAEGVSGGGGSSVGIEGEGGHDSVFHSVDSMAVDASSSATHSILHHPTAAHSNHSIHTSHPHTTHHVHISPHALPPTPEGDETATTPRTPHTLHTPESATSTSTTNTSTTNTTTTTPHSILVDHTHSRSRSVSIDSNRGRLVSHDHAHLPSGLHKRVSFRDSETGEGEGSGGSGTVGGAKFDAHAARMMSPPPVKDEGGLNIKRIESSDHTTTHSSIHSTHHHNSTHATHTIDDTARSQRIAEASGAPHTGSLFGTHFSALLVKRAIYAKRDRRMIFCQLVLPVVLVLLGVTILLIKPDLNQPNLTLSGGKYNTGLSSADRNYIPFSTDGAGQGTTAYEIMSRFNGNPDNGVYGTAVPVQDLGGADAFEGCAQGADVLNDVSQYLLKSQDSSVVDNEHGSSRYAAITIAANTDTLNLNYNILLNGSAIHGVGTYVNLVHQAYLQVVSNKPTAKITVHNFPLPETYKQKNNAATADAFVVALFAMIAFCFVPASFAVFVVKEREVKAKHQQVISGVSIYAYWLSTYLWDIVSYLPTGGLVILLMYIYGVGAYTKADAGPAFILLFALYGPATAAITYLLSFIFASHSTAQIVVMFFNFITGLCLVIVAFVLTTIPNTTHQALQLRYLFRIFPSFCLGDGLIQLALCTDGSSCPLIGENGYNFDGSQGPLAWDITGADLVCLCVHGVLYFVLAVLIEYGLTFPALLSWLYAVEDDEADLQYLGGTAGSGSGGSVHGANQRLLAPGSSEPEDEDVAAERVRVLSGAADNEVVRLQQLRKIYPANSRAGGVNLFGGVRWCWRRALRLFGVDGNGGSGNSSSSGSGSGKAPAFKVAVQSLCFGIPKGQCFGFLGINGAGKTTTLSILSGEFPPTSGEAYIDGFSIRDDQTNIRRRIGYCPQFDALLELLTVREHLELYGRIKGFRGKGLEAIVRGKLVQLDLKDFEHKTAGSLSGGNKRKLSVAVATIGEPSIVFLDEPSTGMDPVARRFMWKVIARMTAEDAACSVILTTHSMEEAEALCSRIGVMVNGRLRCLGPAQHLKLRFGNGFEVNVKLTLPEPSELDAALQRVLRVLHTTTADTTNTFSTTVVDPEAPTEGTLDTITVSRAQITALCEGLGQPQRAALVAPFHSGAMLHEALLSTTSGATPTSDGENTVSLRMFVDWWLAEDAAETLQTFMVNEFGRRAQLLERSTAHNFRYRVQLDEGGENGDNSDGAVAVVTPVDEQHSSDSGAVASNSSNKAQSALSDIFAKFETHKAALHIMEYSVGQTTLEQIFNQFASQQDNPEVLGQARAAAATASAGRKSGK